MNTPPVSSEPSDRLLRTLAAVPVASSILDLCCGGGEHTEALLRLGFPVHACDPRSEAVRETRNRVRALLDGDTAEKCVRSASLDDLDEIDISFDWVVGSHPEAFFDSDDELVHLLSAVRSLLVPGGWFYLILPASVHSNGSTSTNGQSSKQRDDGWSASELKVDRLDTSLVEARSPERVEEHGTARIHAIYRRVEASH